MYHSGYLLSLALTTILLGASWAFADDGDGLIKDRASFIPYRKYEPLKGKVIGILLADGQPILSTEGRSGPPNQLVFGSGGSSYRWVYVPAPTNPMITNLLVPVGDKGENHMYPALDMANPKSVVPWGITKPYTLVEVEVNGGAGSPSNDSFVATSMKALDGTNDYPLKMTEVVHELRKRYAAHLKEKQRAIEKAMKEAAEQHLQGQKPTGPREKTDLMFLTWMPQSKTLRAHFRTRISDGAYSETEGGARLVDPVPEGPAGKERRQPPPPPRFKVKFGTTFGIELGMAYEVARDGKLAGSQTLPIQSFRQVLQPPPQAPSRRGP